VDQGVENPHGDVEKLGSSSLSAVEFVEDPGASGGVADNCI